MPHRIYKIDEITSQLIAKGNICPFVNDCPYLNRQQEVEMSVISHAVTHCGDDYTSCPFCVERTEKRGEYESNERASPAYQA